MKPPIVLTAFGTTSKALETYFFMDTIIKRRLDFYMKLSDPRLKSQVRESIY
jgi:hypothetical protein